MERTARKALRPNRTKTGACEQPHMQMWITRGQVFLAVYSLLENCNELYLQSVAGKHKMSCNEMGLHVLPYPHRFLPRTATLLI